MKPLPTTALLAFSLLTGTACATGQNAPSAPAQSTSGQAQKPRMDHDMMRHDHDGERTDDRDAEFVKLDVDKDGKLSRTELAKHRLAPHFDMLDRNRDGALSPAEFAAGKSM